MTTKHTPGPWRVAGRETRNLPHSLVAADTLLARVYSKCFGDEVEETANARLIAAAPDLLAALKGVLADLDGLKMRPQFNAAHAAVAKATGDNP